MKALVIGAGGFIGTHLVKRLKTEGYYVVGVDLKFQFQDSDESIVGDARDVLFLEEVFKTGFDEVYQLAADMGGATYINSGENDADVMRNSVVINANVANLCKDYNVKKIFFASSACVYPTTIDEHTSTCKEDEVYPANPDNNYGWEKLFSERMYKSFEKQYGIDVKIARFHSIVGEYSTWKGGKEKAHSALARKVSEVEDGGEIDVIGDGNQLRTFLYVGDCIDGIRKLMNSECKEIINLGSDYTVTINQYIDILRKISGKQFSIKYIEGPTGVKQRYCDITKIKNEIGWEPSTSLEEATKITYDWIFHKKKRGIFFNSKNSLCSIWETGIVCYDILSKSQKYLLDYTEDYEFKYKKEYDFAIFNYHPLANNWITKEHIDKFGKSVFCIVTEVSLVDKNYIKFTPSFFTAYIILDPSIEDCGNVYGFPRPLENFKINENKTNVVPVIGSFGFAGQGKKWELILEQTAKEFDEAVVRINISPAKYVPDEFLLDACLKINKKYDEINSVNSKIKLELTTETYSKYELVKWCSQNDINLFFYDRLDISQSGISSAIDQAIIAEKPILVTSDPTFRHVHKYIDYFPNIDIKKAISENKQKVIIMKSLWSRENFLQKFIRIFSEIKFV